MNDTGYDDRPVEKLSIHDLLEQAEQADFDSGYYAGVLNEGASGSEYEPLLTVARDRRNACFTELERRLEAAEALAEKAGLLPQIETALRLAIETFDDDSPGPGLSEREALRGLKEARWQIMKQYACGCGYTEPYGFVVEAGCKLHDREAQDA